MGAKNSTLSFDTGIQMPRKRRTSQKHSHSRKKSHSRKRHTKKNPFPNLPFPIKPPFPTIPPFPAMPPFPNKSPHTHRKSRSHRRSHRRSSHYTALPQGNWINTAKDYYVRNNILYAKLKTKSGNYVAAQTIFSPNQRFQNRNGRFTVLLY